MRARGFLIPLLTTLLASTWPASSHAQAFPEIAFGPRQYTRAAGRPEGVIESFGRCGAGPCRIVVFNGDANGDHRVSSAIVLLNGVQVVGPGDFSQQRHTIIKPVELTDENQLIVELRSQPGSFLTIEVECTPGILSAGASGASLLNPTTLLIALAINNNGSAAAENVQITSITLSGGVLASPSLPVNLGTIPTGGVAVLDADFTGTFAPLGSYGLAVQGTYTVGVATSCFGLDVNLLVPPAAPGSAMLNTASVAAQHVSGAPFPPEPPSFGEEVNEVPGWIVPTAPFVPGTPTPNTTETQAPPQEGFRQEGGPSIVFTANRPLGFNASTCCAEPSGGSGGGVVFMTVNSFAAYSTNGGSSFTKLNPTTIFPNNVDGGFCCDQIVQYVPSIDRFIWLMQFRRGSTGTNRMRIASASPAAIISSGGTAWTYWDLTSGFFGLSGWLDYPDLSVGNNYLYMSCDAVGVGLQVARMPLSQIQASGTIFVEWTNPTLGRVAYFGHLTQNTGDEIFWAGHNSNSSMRIFSLAEGSNFYFWRDRGISSWATNALSSTTPDGQNWISSSPRFPNFPAVLGATRTGSELWFAWTAGTDNFFQQPHVEMMRLNRSNDFSVIQQVQIWNNSYAFGYPALSTNACTFEVGLSLEYGGNGNYENHVVGIWGDFVVYLTTASNVGTTRFGDYVTIRQQPASVANPGNLFDAFGYGLNTSTSGVQTDVRYVAFGRPPSDCIGLQSSNTPLAMPEVISGPDPAIAEITPNPIIGDATIALMLPHRGRVRANVYDLQGRVVCTLLDEVRDAGPHVLRWARASGRGPRLSAGVYLVSVSTDAATVTRRVIVLE